jgi:hypothetical protein
MSLFCCSLWVSSPNPYLNMVKAKRLCYDEEKSQHATANRKAESLGHPFTGMPPQNSPYYA